MTVPDMFSPAAYGGLQSDLTSLLDCGGHKDGLDQGQVYNPAPGANTPSMAYSVAPHQGHMANNNMGNNGQMKTFYQRQGSTASSVAPYATTTLINKGVNPNPTPRPSQSSVSISGRQWAGGQTGM